MRKIIWAFGLLLLGVQLPLHAAMAGSPTKIDPLLKMIAKKPVIMMSLAAKASKTDKATGQRLIDCFIRATDPQAVADKLKKIGGPPRSVLSRVLTAHIPADTLH